MKKPILITLAISIFVIFIYIFFFVGFMGESRFEKWQNKNNPPKEPDGAPGSNQRTAKSVFTEYILNTPFGKWIVKGEKPQGRSCPMGQSTIWNGKTWACAVRSADQA